MVLFIYSMIILSGGILLLTIGIDSEKNKRRWLYIGGLILTAIGLLLFWHALPDVARFTKNISI